MLARKLASYRLHMAAITPHKQKFLIVIVVLNAGKILVRLDQNKEKNNMKK